MIEPIERKKRETSCKKSRERGEKERELIFRLGPQTSLFFAAAHDSLFFNFIQRDDDDCLRLAFLS